MTNLVESLNKLDPIVNWIFYILGAVIVVAMIYNLNSSKRKVEKEQAFALMSMLTVCVIGIMALLRVLSIIFHIDYTRTIDPLEAIIECAVIYHIAYYYYTKKNK